jgi:hypothetical protein
MAISSVIALRGTVGRKLEFDPLGARIRFFFDTPDLTLSEHGLVVRARRSQGREHDSVVKSRPVETRTCHRADAGTVQASAEPLRRAAFHEDRNELADAGAQALHDRPEHTSGPVPQISLTSYMRPSFGSFFDCRPSTAPPLSAIGRTRPETGLRCVGQDHFLVTIDAAGPRGS